MLQCFYISFIMNTSSNKRIPLYESPTNSNEKNHKLKNNNVQKKSKNKIKFVSAIAKDLKSRKV